jgi:uncharacterized protein YjbI with pentapeptide repeats
MANQKHLDLLRQVVKWHKWRAGTPASVPDLSDANLSMANLARANLSMAILSRTNLSMANLNRAKLWTSSLDHTNFERAHVSRTVFGNVDLSSCDGLDFVEHLGPSTLGVDSIIRSKGQIPKSFL